MDIISVEHLTKEYHVGNSTFKALDDVSFTVKKGAFVAIIGASGSGKSTLLHLMGGVDTPTQGRVIVDGWDVSTLSAKELAKYRRKKVSTIYQFYNLLPMLNVRSNILLPLELDGATIDDKKVVNIMKMLGIFEKEFYYPNQLSGGQQQRVAIARALITEPAVLLADEPTGNLDSKNSEEVITLIKESVQKLGQTVVMVTHDDKVASQADRVITLSDGKIINDSLV